MSAEAPTSTNVAYYGSLDQVIDITPSYYGHYLDPLSGAQRNSAEIETSLRELPQSPALHAVLQAIFSSPEWREQNAPVKLDLLRHGDLRVKELDETGKEWWPCQLGCPDRIPLTLKRKRIEQSTHATTHIDWHLGLKRYDCSKSYCRLTFLRNNERINHEQLHDNPNSVPCAYGWEIFAHERNRTRHYRETCPNNPDRIGAAPRASISSSSSGSG